VTIAAMRALTHTILVRVGTGEPVELGTVDIPLSYGPTDNGTVTLTADMRAYRRALRRLLWAWFITEAIPHARTPRLYRPTGHHLPPQEEGATPEE
jgi:hypothetical protein